MKPHGSRPPSIIMLKSRWSATPRFVAALLIVSLIALCAFAAYPRTPSEATTYRSHDDLVKDFTTARPAALGDRCYEETTGTALCSTGQTCIDSGRTPWWDHQRGAYRIIPFQALHTLGCTSLCCPQKPPMGTCYKKWLTASCATGYTTAYKTILSGSLCCTPGSCFWFRTSITNCNCPNGYEPVDRTDSCTAGGWAMCCPVDGPAWSSMQLSDVPFESVRTADSVRAVGAPPPPPPPTPVGAIAAPDKMSSSSATVSVSPPPSPKKLAVESKVKA